jgi:hypothetical protein
MALDPATIQALTFDVFGTVVDWRSSIIREGEALGQARGLRVDWAKFADAWRGLYQPNMDRVPPAPSAGRSSTTCTGWPSTSFWSTSRSPA